MAIGIRLSRGGVRSVPTYIVVADARSSRDGKFIEKIGTYNPLLAKDDEKRIVLDGERAKHWLSVGAQPTSSRSLPRHRGRPRARRAQQSTKGKLGEKATERAEERAEKQEAAEEAAAEAAAAAPSGADRGR